jgi:hypothetical protein
MKATIILKPFYHNKNGNIPFGTELFLNDNDYTTNDLTFSLPKDFVENNPGIFELYKEPISYINNIPKYIGDTVFGVCPKNNWEFRERVLRRYKHMEFTSNWIWFNSEKECKEYIKLNKKNFSINELSVLFNDFLMCYTNPYSKEYELILEDLKCHILEKIN